MGFVVLSAFVLAPLAFAGTAAAGPDGADTSSAPWIASDKPDYAPGERVTLDGGNWQPGESVRIEVEDDQGKTWQRDVSVSADAAGAISDSFDLPEWFVATYSVRATGSSGAVATSSFTDGNVQVQTNAGGPTVTLTYKRYSATNCTGAPSSTQTATISPTSGGTNLFAQDTGSFSLEVPASSGSDDFDGWTSQANFSSASNPLCFNAISGNRTFTAHYVEAAARATTTAVASDANPSTYGGPVTFTATVTAAGGNPSDAGTVTFRNGASALCSAVALAGNTATCTTSALVAAASPHSITAEYSGTTSGSPQFQPSTSAPLSQAVDRKPVTGGVTVADKVYDGTADATITGRSLTGAVAGDDVELSGGAASFADKHAGEDKPVTVAGATLAGDDKDNYTLGAVGANDADITPLGISGSFTAADKEYDGTADAEITGRSLTGAIADDDVELSGGTASFDDRHAGADKPVTGSGFTLAGADKDNYTLGSVADTTASITPRPLGLDAHGVDRLYDGTTDASVTFTDDRIAGDAFTIDYSASFADKHVGEGKPVAVSAISLSGDDAGNYSLASTSASTTADITPRALTVTATGVNKVYDGTTDATVALSDDRVADDELETGYADAAFEDADAGPGKPVNVSGISVTGADAGNYTFNTTASTTADIAPRPITVTADPKSKPFGAPDPALTYAVSGGPLVAGDGFSGSLTRVAGEAVGGHDILQGTVSAGPNYAIAYVGAKLTIEAWHALGFHQPIGAGNSQVVPAPGAAPHVSTAVWNTAKGGSTIPLKFNLYTAQGGQERTSTEDVKEFQAVRLSACSGGEGEEAVEFVTSGSTSLRYDATERQFVQNWKTPSVAKDECYRVNVRFQDGSAIYAFVKLRK